MINSYKNNVVTIATYNLNIKIKKVLYTLIFHKSCVLKKLTINANMHYRKVSIC